ncbi:MAG: alpha/beta hydrolase [Lachnoclostridium sp.]|nr:alpha/beta hydrolase [Lachnoclostridium sp.]
MLIVFIIIISVIALVTFSVLVLRLINSNKNKIDTESGIQESTYIDIDGMKQYIQIRGESTENPVMIFIHGGPASPMGYVSAYYQRELESELTIINYDQRGCGRTYYANDCNANADIDLLVNDLNIIVEYVKKRFGKKNVIIAGHSWGTVIGSIYVQKYPENVNCYIGISQITNLYKNKLNVARTALEKDEIKGTEDEQKLTELIKRMSRVNDYNDMSLDDLSQLVTATSKYIACEGEMSGLSQMITGITSPDMNFDDMKWFMLQMNTEKFFAQNKDIMEYAFFGFDINLISKTYNVPVYYLAGKGDYAVCQKDAQAYYESIEAPDKAFYWIENAGHSMFMDNPELYCDTVKNILSQIEKAVSE